MTYFILCVHGGVTKSMDSIKFGHALSKGEDIHCLVTSSLDGAPYVPIIWSTPR